MKVIYINLKAKFKAKPWSILRHVRALRSRDKDTGEATGLPQIVMCMFEEKGPSFQGAATGVCNLLNGGLPLTMG